MNATITNNLQITALDFDLVSKLPNKRAPRPSARLIKRINAEEELNRLILQDGKGRSLLRFCNELAAMLIRNYLNAYCTDAVRKGVCENLVETLACTEQQAHCLVDLALELIHVRVHNDYRYQNVNLDYQISMATKALNSDFAEAG